MENNFSKFELTTSLVAIGKKLPVISLPTKKKCSEKNLLTQPQLDTRSRRDVFYYIAADYTDNECAAGQKQWGAARICFTVAIAAFTLIKCGSANNHR
ncbi:hypothetical protein [Nitrosomonas ureae]|uniref:hypothetical protein n=1 Tax=Nitrosomonas ureae TaxID=44577 RepID=UPI001F32B07E|nr:hypothetical protein [Nitrosomonas ureae]